MNAATLPLFAPPPPPTWREIATDPPPKHCDVLLFHPGGTATSDTRGRKSTPAPPYVRIGPYPPSYPRIATHWAEIPPLPQVTL